MKKLLFLGACLVALASSPVQAQTGETQVAVNFKRVTSTHVQAVITRKGEKPLVQDRKGNGKERAQFRQQVVAKLTQEGYALKTPFDPGTEASSALVFTKQKKPRRSGRGRGG